MAIVSASLPSPERHRSGDVPLKRVLRTLAGHFAGLAQQGVPLLPEPPPAPGGPGPEQAAGAILIGPDRGGGPVKPNRNGRPVAAVGAAATGLPLRGGQRTTDEAI